MARRKSVDPGKIRVRVLGTTEILVGHRRIGMNTEVLFALALYLTTRAGERIPREELLPLFWNEGSEEDRRHALRQQMYRLRQKGLEVDDGGELIMLDPQRVESDLRSALEEDWWESATEDDITRACEWGPVFARHKSPAFHEWMDSMRNALGQNIRRAALRQIGIARREGRWADLDRWGRVMISTDPLNEEGTLARAESAAMGGSKTIALEIIDNYLSEIGDIDPDLNKPALQLRKRIAERRPDWAMRGPKEVPLVGRMELMTKLTGLVEDVWKGEGRAVVLTGAAGIGKTRLAMEARAYAELKGMRVVKLRADPASSSRPLAALHDLIASLLELPGAAGCHPDSLQLLKRTLEQSGKLSRPDVTAMMVSISDRIPDAVVDLVDAIGHECRSLVIVDDLHHLDSHSFQALELVLGATMRRRIGWIFTARERARSGDSRAPLPTQVVSYRVLPLATSFARDLASSTSTAHGLRLSQETLDSLVRTAGGNPLFVRELAVASRHRPNAAGLPESLSRLIEERLTGLTPEQQESLAAIAFLGETATLELLELSTERPARALASDLDSLENDGVVVVSESRHFVLHECWRQAVLDGLTGAVRAALAKRCADAVCRVDEGRRTTQHDWCAAQLYEEAGYVDLARKHYLRASDGLYSNGFPAESVRVVRIAKNLAHVDTASLEVQSRLASGLLASGEHTEAIAESSRAVKLVQQAALKDRASAAALLCTRVDALIKAGRPLDDEIQALAMLSGDRSLPLKLRQGCALMGIIWASNACNDSLKREFHAANSRLHDDEQHSLAGHMVNLIFACEVHSPSDVRDAIQALRAADVSDESMYLRCRALRTEARALREFGLDDEARIALNAAYELAESAHLASDACVAAELLTFVELDAQNLETAESWLARFEQLTPNKLSYERASAISHCRDRLHLQRGDVEIAAVRLQERAPDIRADWNQRRKASELSNLAYAFAHLRQAPRAYETIAEVESLLSSEMHGFAADYPVEMICRSLRLLGNDERAIAFAEGHVSRTFSLGARHFAPFFRELNSLAANSPAKARD